MLLLERIDVLGKDITMELRQDTNVCPLLHDKIFTANSAGAVFA